MPIRNRFAELHDEITAWRRDFHQHPELGYEEHRTAGIVAEKLKEFGCDEVVTGIGGTGVVGLIHGRGGATGKVLGLRADMDALPIAEETGAAHASTIAGKMHACGHDGHTAMLLGAAKYLAETRHFNGTAAVIFQPAEEGLGGAKAMIDDDMMSRFGISEVYGLHNVPGREMGSFAIRPGPFYAFADRFELTVTGRAGHAAQPHLCVDPVVASAQMIAALQTVASRTVDPIDAVVISTTSVETSTTAYNIIPQSVEMKGTVRTLRKEVQALTEARMAAIIEGIAAASGVKAAFNFVKGYPGVINHEEPTDFAASVAREIAGGCDDADLTMWGEDFSYMLEERPGAYIHLGVGEGPALHHPTYDFPDAVIPVGCSWLAGLVEARMPAA